MALLPPDLTVQVCACLEREAAAVIPDNKARSVVADWLSILNQIPICAEEVVNLLFCHPDIKNQVHLNAVGIDLNSAYEEPSRLASAAALLHTSRIPFKNNTRGILRESHNISVHLGLKNSPRASVDRRGDGTRNL